GRVFCWLDYRPATGCVNPKKKGRQLIAGPPHQSTFAGSERRYRPAHDFAGSPFKSRVERLHISCIRRAADGNGRTENTGRTILAVLIVHQPHGQLDNCELWRSISLNAEHSKIGEDLIVDRQSVS